MEYKWLQKVEVFFVVLHFITFAIITQKEILYQFRYNPIPFFTITTSYYLFHNLAFLDIHVRFH